MFTARNPAALLRQTRGLTLLEVVTGLAVLSLLAGAIYSVVMGSVESTATLSAIQAEDRRVETFLNRTREAFAYLPQGATVELKVIEPEPLRQELIIRGVPEAFVWGATGRWNRAEVTLCPQRRPETVTASAADAAAGTAPALYSLAMSVPDFYRAGPDGEPLPDSVLRSRQGHQLLVPDNRGRFWFDLLPETGRAEWRFYDPAKKLWIEQQGPGRPPLIELRLLLPGRKFPIRAVFETA